MKRLLFSGVFLLATIIGVYAQSVKDGPSTGSASTWQGAYIGIGIGGLFDYHDIGGTTNSVSSIGTNGWTESAIIGYDLALNNVLVGAWVEGYLEQAPAKLGPIAIKAENGGSIGGRLGYLVGPGILAYGKLGYALDTYRSNYPGAHLAAIPGITYGAGFEYNVVNSIFLRTEYRHEDYQPVAFGPSLRDSLSEDRVTLGVTYKFNGGAKSPLNILPNLATSGYTPLK